MDRAQKQKEGGVDAFGFPLNTADAGSGKELPEHLKVAQVLARQLGDEMDTKLEEVDAKMSARVGEVTASNRALEAKVDALHAKLDALLGDPKRTTVQHVTTFDLIE